MIKEQFVSFEIAKLLKEIGFDIPINTSYSKDGKFEYNILPNNFNKLQSRFSGPTQSLAARWLRGKFSIHIFTNYFFEDGTWFYVIVDLKESDEIRAIHPDIRSYQSSEEAFEEGLRESINLIKKQKL